MKYEKFITADLKKQVADVLQNGRLIGYFEDTAANRKRALHAYDHFHVELTYLPGWREVESVWPILVLAEHPEIAGRYKPSSSRA